MDPTKRYTINTHQVVKMKHGNACDENKHGYICLADKIRSVACGRGVGVEGDVGGQMLLVKARNGTR